MNNGKTTKTNEFVHENFHMDYGIHRLADEMRKTKHPHFFIKMSKQTFYLRVNIIRITT